MYSLFSIILNDYLYYLFAKRMQRYIQKILITTILQYFFKNLFVSY